MKDVVFSHGYSFSEAAVSLTVEKKVVESHQAEFPFRLTATSGSVVAQSWATAIALSPITLWLLKLKRVRWRVLSKLYAVSVVEDLPAWAIKLQLLADPESGHSRGCKSPNTIGAEDQLWMSKHYVSVFSLMADRY